MLLSADQWPLAPSWVAFLEGAGGGKPPSRDSWCMLLEFMQSVRPDLSDYDASGASERDRGGGLVVVVEAGSWWLASRQVLPLDIPAPPPHSACHLPPGCSFLARDARRICRVCAGEPCWGRRGRCELEGLRTY